MTRPEYEDYVGRYIAYRFRGNLDAGAPFDHRRLLDRFKEVLFPTFATAVDFESDATVLSLDRWIRTTLGPKNQPVAMRALKWFCRWLHGSGIIRVNLAADLPGIRRTEPPKIKSTVSEAQFRALQKHSLGVWYYWPITVGWYTGLAMSDACNLRWGEVDMKECIIRKNRMKTASPCTVPFMRDGELHQMLESRQWAYRNGTRPKLDGETDDPKFDFVDYESASRMRKGKVETMSDLFEKLKRRAGITDPRLTIHSLRVSFCSRLANSQVNMAVAMAMTGHKTVTMFKTYVRPTEESLRQGLETAFGVPPK